MARTLGWVAGGGHRSRSRPTFLSLCGIAFLLAYVHHITAVSGPREYWGGALVSLLAVPLAVNGWLRGSRFVRVYALVIGGAFVVVLVALPLDLNALVLSTARLNDVVGLLAILGMLAIPLQEPRYRASISDVIQRLADRGLRDTATATVLAFVLGQLLAFSVVPLLDEFLAHGSDRRSFIVSRWAVRGFSLTLLAAITFPSVSVAIDVFAVRPGSYLLLSMPLATVLLVVATIMTRREEPLPKGHGEGDRGSGDATALTMVVAYFVFMVVFVVALAGRLGISYLGVVSLVVLVAAFGLAASSRALFGSDSIRRLWAYFQNWWEPAASAVIIFFSSGVLLYVLEESEVLAILASGVVRWGGPTPIVLYPLFSALVLVLFLVGVSPIVTIHVVALTLAGTGLAADVSMLGLTLALMTGNVAALPVSPFSALTNIRAIMTRSDALTAPAENAWFCIGVFTTGNLYIMALHSTGWL